MRNLVALVPSPTRKQQRQLKTASKTKSSTLLTILTTKICLINLIELPPLLARRIPKPEKMYLRLTID